MNSIGTYDEYGLDVDVNGPEEQQLSCPKCSKQRKKKRVKCLSVNIQKQCWVCHHCGWAGTLKKGGHYNDPHYIKPDYLKPKVLPSNPKIPSPVMQWFAKRGISNTTLTRNKIFVDRVYMPQIESTVNAVGFPYFRDGEHINTKWRDNSKNFRLEAGAELLMYGLDDIKDSETVIIVEGEMDKLAVEEAGYTNCVSLPNGAPSPNAKTYTAHFDHLGKIEALLADKKFILFVDADEAGQLLEAELSRRLGRERCKRVKLPVGYKDANEFLIKQDCQKLKEIIDNSKSYPVAGIHTAKSLYGSVLRMHEKGITGGEKTGWTALDYLYSVRAGEMTIVTGIPNHGKSYFLDCMTLNIAKDHGWRFGIFSPENQPLERHAAGYVEKYNRKPFNDLTVDYVEATMTWLESHYYWILPDADDDWSLKSILDKAQALVYTYGINGLIIDPYNEIEHRRPKSMSETEYISVFLSDVRNFARKHQVHIWVVAHPTKLRKDEKTGLYPVATPYDISGSSNWRNKADNCLSVYRDFSSLSSNKVSIYVQKIRFAEIGKVGHCDLIYDGTQCNYREAGHFDKMA